MFIGHFAVAFAAKRVAPKASLGPLLAAALLPDFVWPVLVLTGVEKVVIEPGNTAFTPLNFVAYPWSHSLLMVAIIGGVAGLVYAGKTGYPRGAVTVALLAISHWVLDWISHRPDLPLSPGNSPLLGLGLWNSVPATLLVEGGLFFVGVLIYAACTRARDLTGRYAFWSLVIFLAALYVGDRFSAPPPSDKVIGWVGLIGGILFVAWAGWADAHREMSARTNKVNGKI